MRRDAYTKFKVEQNIGAVVLAADNTEVTVDMKGATELLFVLCVGIGGITFDATNKVSVTLNESDDDSTYTAVADVDIKGISPETADSGIVLLLDSAHAAALTYHWSYIGSKRYVQVLADFAGTHGTGTPMSLVAIKGGLNLTPDVA